MAAFVCQWLWEPHFSQQKTKSTGHDHQTPEFRSLTLRVDQISSGTSRQDLQRQLDALLAGSSDLQDHLNSVVVRSMVARNNKYICASVTVRTQLPEIHLLHRLGQASEVYDYQWDCSFHGITPLHEDANGAYYEYGPPLPPRVSFFQLIPQRLSIIAVPGLASHAIGSFKKPGGNDVWLRD